MRSQQALADALATVKKFGQDLVSRVKVFEAKREVKAAVNSGFLLDLWQPDQHSHQPVTFDVCFSSTSLDVNTGSDLILFTDAAYARTTILLGPIHT
jgi:hypothetical protein